MSSSYNSVQWQEGMLLKPQHFQQQDRANRYLIKLQAKFLHSYYWGFHELEIDTEAVREGYLVINRAQGIFIDGSFFSIPDLNKVPEPLNIRQLKAGTFIYLATPKEASAAQQLTEAESAYTYKTLQVADCENTILDVCDINTKTNKLVLLDNSPSIELSYLKIGELELLGSDNQARFNECFIPAITNIHSSPYLISRAKRLIDQIREKILNKQFVPEGTNQYSISEHIQFSNLKEAYSQFNHLIQQDTAHPERLFAALLKLSSQLSIASHELETSRFIYEHHNLSECFRSLMDYLKHHIDTLFNFKVIKITLQEDEYGFWLSDSIKNEYLNKKLFIIIKNLKNESLKSEHALRHLKIGTPKYIYTLVNKALPGINLQPVKSTHPALHHAEDGLVFKLEQQGKYWDAVLHECRIAVHGTQALGEFLPELWVLE